MDFLLWATKSLHLFAVIVWLGGLLYQSVVVLPMARAGNLELSERAVPMLIRFLPFIWMAVWTTVITGLVLMLFSTRFLFFSFSDRWSVLLGLKELAFLLMAFFSFGFSRMLAGLRESESQSQRENSRVYFERMTQFNAIIIALGIAAMLLASGL